MPCQYLTVIPHKAELIWQRKHMHRSTQAEDTVPLQHRTLALTPTLTGLSQICGDPDSTRRCKHPWLWWTRT